MIRSHAQFEFKLDEATRLLDEPPADGTPEHEKLLDLMREIAAYRPAVQVEAPKATSETDRLSRQLDAFEARLAPPFAPHWHAMLGGDLRPASAPTD
ncbi:MAG: hypothetical protein ABI740_02645 [Alphaproteobacteria bacterium]